MQMQGCINDAASGRPPAVARDGDTKARGRGRPVVRYAGGYAQALRPRGRSAREPVVLQGSDARVDLSVGTVTITRSTAIASMQGRVDAAETWTTPVREPADRRSGTWGCH